MFPAFLQCRTHRPPLLAWMLLTTRGKKFKPYKPEKTAEQVGRMLPSWSEWQSNQQELVQPLQAYLISDAPIDLLSIMLPAEGGG